jgi:hypothetical protein
VVGRPSKPAEIVDSHAICDVGEKVGAGRKVQVCLARGGKVVSHGHVSVVSVADCFSTRESLLP